MTSLERTHPKNWYRESEVNARKNIDMLDLADVYREIADAYTRSEHPLPCEFGMKNL